MDPLDNKIEQLATRFHALFSGLPRAHGAYTLSGDTDDRGKEKGEAKTKRAPVTLDLWRQHLEGRQGLGIVPIRDDNTCVFGAVDIDVYDDLNHAGIATGLKELELPTVVCRSKSGGCHIYLFSAVPVAASLMQARLSEIKALIGHGKAEVFPKQKKITPTEHGNWINIPYFEGNASTRYAIRPDSSAMTPAEFLDYAEASKVGTEFFRSANKQGPERGRIALPDGPPCLNNLVRIGMPEGGRNDFLFNLAVYSKRAHPSTWREDIENYNRGYCHPPLGHEEIGKIIKSVSSKDYNYSCSREPLTSHCNRGVCRMRKFGIGNGGESFPEFGLLTKYVAGTSVEWRWELEDGIRLALTTDQLLTYRLFKRACAEALTKILPEMKQAEWEQNVAKAFQTAHTEIIDDDMSPAGQLWYLLEKFCTGTTQAFAMEEIALGRPFTNEGKTHFRLMDFTAFLERQHFRELPTAKIPPVLKERGASVKPRRLPKSGTYKVWEVPAFTAQTEGYDMPPAIENIKGPY